MSIATVVTGGFGSFGTVNSVVVIGFSVGGPPLDVTSTDVLQKPVNAVMMGNQPIRKVENTFDLAPKNVRVIPVGRRGSVRKLD